MDARQDRRFEEAWHEAFEGVELAPPDQVWSGIEDALDGKHRKPISKRIWLLKLAMAASVVYGMSTTGLNLNERGFSFSPDSEPENVISLSEENVLINPAAEYQEAGVLMNEAIGQYMPLFKDTDLLSSLSLPGYSLVSPATADIQKFPMLPLFRSNTPRGMSASVAFTGGAGSASQAGSALNGSVYEGGLARAVADANAVTLDGPILNLGIGFRARLHENWVLLTGVNYQQRSGTGKAYYVQENGGSPAVWVGDGNAPNVIETEPYNVDHRLQYVSVPVQVGYKVADSKVDVTLYGGISNDILVKHEVGDSERQLASSNVTDSSSFRRYGVSGIVSAEVSYDINDNYSVGIYPQLRKPLTSLAKNTESRPLSVEMGLRLSYNIN